MSILQRLARKSSVLLLCLPAVVFAASFSVKTHQISPPGNVNINKADVKVLSQLSGISRKRADAIVSYRKSHGGFKSIDELTKIRGIGKSFVKKYRKQLKVK